MKNNSLNIIAIIAITVSILSIIFSAVYYDVRMEKIKLLKYKTAMENGYEQVLENNVILWKKEIKILN